MSAPSKGLVASLVVVFGLAIACGGGYFLVMDAAEKASSDQAQRQRLELTLTSIETALTDAGPAPAEDWHPEDWLTRFETTVGTTQVLPRLRVLHWNGADEPSVLRDDGSRPLERQVSETLVRAPHAEPLLTLIQDIDARTRLVSIRQTLVVGEEEHVFLAIWAEERP